MLSASIIPVIVVFGPTATGKTDFLLNLSKVSDSGVYPEALTTNLSSFHKFVPEIINSDSLQVYKYMDIGTAKPNAETLSKIKHHLIDFLNPNEEFNTANFVHEADKLCKEIFSRGKVPVISGGNAFFLINFIKGLPATPQSNPKVREQVEAELKSKGIEQLARKLEEIDPLYFSKICKNDTYRIMRALEIYYSTGKRVSHYKIPDIPRECYDFLFIGLIRERGELYERINKRVDLMFENGLYNEFLKLREMGYGANDPGMSAIGYKEFFELEKNDGQELLNLDDIKELIKKNTRHYAKRQITFFKKIDNVVWENPDNSPAILREVQQFLKKHGKEL
ncbi:MAG: tRNA (adenosine(37)-N6)-dimethylallyltransferase MiaA [Spirochaetes bacterium]|nr:tRNA (adenosine(37)-N6)-dimethylallyltransferase MiaA [Spirochaetota bacterium]